MKETSLNLLHRAAWQSAPVSVSCPRVQRRRNVRVFDVCVYCVRASYICCSTLGHDLSESASPVTLAPGPEQIRLNHITSLKYCFGSFDRIPSELPRMLPVLPVIGCLCARGLDPFQVGSGGIRWVCCNGTPVKWRSKTMNIAVKLPESKVKG